MPESRAESTGTTDWELLAATADGDDEAFRTLVERHQDRLIRLCDRILGDRDEALDVAQEVLLKLYEKASSLRPQGQLYTWLYRVATNFCLNRLRRRRIVRFLPIGDDNEDSAAFLEPVESRPGPDRALESKRRWAATRSAIESLPDNQRVVLILAKFEGMSYREISRTLEITEGAVESRLFRAIRNLTRSQVSDDSRVSQEEETV